MKKTWSLLFILSILMNFSDAQSDTINKLDKKGLKQGYWIKNEKGKTLYEGRFLNDNPQGVFKYYNPDGKIKNISRFEKNGSVSYTTVYHVSGNVSAIGKYVDRQYDSVWTFLNDGGKKVKVESYKLGVPHGKWQIFDPKDGILLDEKNFVDGKKHGSWRTFYTTGEPRFELKYVNDVATGAYKCFYTSGKIWHTGIYKNSRFDGLWISYAEDGPILRRMRYENGEKTESTIYAYTRWGNLTMVSQDSISYISAYGDNTILHLFSGEKITTKYEIFFMRDYFIDSGFFPVTDKIYVRNLSIKKIDPQGKDAFQIELFPSYGAPIMVVGDYARTLKSLRDRSKIERP